MNQDEMKQWVNNWRDHCRETCIEINCADGMEKCRQAHKQIVALIGASKEVTEEWIEEKAIRLFKMAMKWFNNDKTTSQQKVEIGQGFILSLVEEIQSHPNLMENKTQGKGNKHEAMSSNR